MRWTRQLTCPMASIRQLPVEERIDSSLCDKYLGGAVPLQVSNRAACPSLGNLSSLRAGWLELMIGEGMIKRCKSEPVCIDRGEIGSSPRAKNAIRRPN